MLRIQITKSGLAAIGKNGYREAGRLAILAAATLWFKNFLPLHFQNIAYTRYRYAQRDKRTNALKQQRRPWPFGENLQAAIGEVKPLVFSGRSRASAIHSRNITAKAKNFETYRADVVIMAPAFNFGAGKRIDMRDEVTRITPQENVSLELEFARVWEKELKAQGLKAPRQTRTTAA